MTKLVILAVTGLPEAAKNQLLLELVSTAAGLLEMELDPREWAPAAASDAAHAAGPTSGV